MSKWLVQQWIVKRENGAAGNTQIMTAYTTLLLSFGWMNITYQVLHENNKKCRQQSGKVIKEKKDRAKNKSYSSCYKKTQMVCLV